MPSAANYINSVLEIDKDSRPVLCDGRLDQKTDVMILAHNPGWESPPLDHRFWDGESCDRQAWLDAWSWGRARQRIENDLLPCLHGLRVVECNLSHYRSKEYKDLPKEKKKTDVFVRLIELLAPKLVVTFASGARKHFDKVSAKGSFVKRTIGNVTFDVFLGDHLIMGGAQFWQGDRFELLGNRARQICSEPE